MDFIITWGPTIIIFILMLGVLILFHEFGHFFAAKKSGMKVKEFGFGYPPRIWGKKVGDTIYSINLLPLGGFVKILGEDEESDSKNAFGNKPIKNRIFVIISGVLMNFILAFIAFMIAFWCSLPPLISSPEAYRGAIVEGSGGLYVEAIEKDSLAQNNDIERGDLIYRIDGVANPTVIDLRKKISENQGTSIELKIKRGEEAVDKKIDIGENPQLGVGVIQKLEKVKYSWWKVPYYAFLETVKSIWFIAVAIIIFLKNLMISGAVPGEVLGPVGIFGITSVAVKLGFAYVLNLLIILTINLGIINILPFPALDGGRLVFLVVEKIRGKKVAQGVENVIHNIGFLILIILIILITWRDILRL